MQAWGGRGWRVAAACAGLGVAVACAAPRGAGVAVRPLSSRAGSRVITRADIKATLATNVWDLLRRVAPMYSYAEDRYGRASAIRSSHGRSSIYLPSADMPLVVIDGARLSDFSALQQMPAADVAWIELQTGLSGTTAEGTNAGSGVIYIHTWLGSAPPDGADTA